MPNPCKLRGESAEQKPSQPARSQQPLTLIWAAGREQFFTFAPCPLSVHKAALFLNCTALIRTVGADKVWIKSPLLEERKVLYKEAKIPNNTELFLAQDVYQKIGF